MSPERTHAYRRVLHTLDELGPSKLQVAEQERIREAADTLIFCQELDHDDAAIEALEDTELLCELLVESGPWERVTADRLAAEICPGRPEPALNLSHVG